MANRTVAVGLLAKVSGFVAGMRTAGKSVGDFNKKLLDGSTKHKADLDKLSNAAGVFGVAMLGAATLAIKSFADFDASMSKVQAATHASAGEMRVLREAALDAGKRTAFSATEAAGAIENLAKAGVSTKDILGGALDGALSLAAAGELEVADAAEIAATAMTQFKLKGSDVPHIADLLAAGAGKAQGEVSDLAMALKQGGLVAAQAGLSIEETTGTLASFASAGLLGSDAGTSLKTMLLQLMNPSKESAALMQQLGITAYDSSGAFVSMTDLAQQLKVRLGGLSEEQRNSALATIFGSDAIRAASVLYQQGGKGIQDWTKKVDDAGFAAETAALRMDNLKGDLEQLQGSLQTALIETGDGADSAARQIVQALTGIVSSFLELPTGAQQAVLMSTIFLGAVGLVTSGVIKAITGFAELRAALAAVGISMKTAAIASAGLGIALAAATFAIGIWAQNQAEAKGRVDSLTDSLDKQTGALTKASAAQLLATAQQKGWADVVQDAGISQELFVEALKGTPSAIDEVVRQYNASATAVQTLGEHTQGATEKAAGLEEFLRSNKGEVADARRKWQQMSEAHLADASATDESTQALKMSTAAAKENEDAVSPAAEMLGEMEKRAKDLKDALDLLNGTMSKREIEANYQESIDAVTERLGAYREEVKNGDAATKGMKDAFDLNTKAGRDNDAVLMAVWESAGAVAEQTMRLTGNQKSANKVLSDARGKLVEMATEFFNSKEKAEEYVTTTLGIPKNVKTKVEAPGLDPTLAKAKQLQTTWLSIDGKTVRSYVSVYHTDFYSSIRDTNPKRGGQKSPPKGGPRAAGGPYDPGKVTLVGENGPELLTGGQRGWVSTAAQTSAIMAGLTASDHPWTKPGAKPWQQMPMYAGAYGGGASPSAEPRTVNNTFNMRRIDLNERTFQTASRVAQLRERVGRPR